MASTATQDELYSTCCAHALWSSIKECRQQRLRFVKWRDHVVRSFYLIQRSTSPAPNNYQEVPRPSIACVFYSRHVNRWELLSLQRASDLLDPAQAWTFVVGVSSLLFAAWWWDRVQGYLVLREITSEDWIVLLCESRVNIEILLFPVNFFFVQRETLFRWSSFHQADYHKVLCCVLACKRLQLNMMCGWHQL